MMPMANPQPIECKPTAWFLCRATIIFLMFAVFTVLFYIDGSTGYRKKNQVYFLHNCFKVASDTFAEKNADRSLKAETWRTYAADQTVTFPDQGILPAGLELPMKWPEILHSYERMKSLQWKQLWLEYSEAEELDSNPPEKVYDARAIREQWIFFWICGALALLALFFLIRTSRRRVIADDECLLTQDGRRVPYADMHRLDLRKWDNKGIAFVDYEGSAGKGRARIDGLTYGGFKKEHEQPAERLMQLLRSKFSGELVEYTSVENETEADADSGQDGKPEP